MSWLQFVASIVQSLAWPGVVVALVFILKSPIRALLGRIKTAKGYGVELSFSEAADRVRAAVAEIDERAAGQPGRLAAQSPEVSLKQVRVPEDVDPTYTVLLAWQQVDEAVIKLAKRAGIEHAGSGYLSPVMVMRELTSRGVVQDSYAVAVRSLGSLRNAVAHGQRAVTPEEARAFVGSAADLVRATDALTATMTPPPKTDANAPAPVARPHARAKRPSSHQD